MKNKLNSKLKSSNEIPNKTTLEAYKEVEDMEMNPNKYKTFNSLESLMDDLLD